MRYKTSMSNPVRLPDSFVEELKARIRLSDIIGRKVRLKKQGKEWVGLSPFTNEKTPSFYVNDQKQIFKCFSSGVGGDVIAFVMQTERLSFIEAVRKLADEAGMALPQMRVEDRKTQEQRQRLYAVCEAAAVYFESCLRTSHGDGARRHLEKRGRPPATWSHYRLGFAPDDWQATSVHLMDQGFAKDDIIAAGLAVAKDGGQSYDRFRGRLIFPIEDRNGAVIAFGGRALASDSGPKYLNSSDTILFQKSHILYRYKPAREAFGTGDESGLVVCEGYMDAIALSEAGFGHAVATLGTALTDGQLNLLWNAGPEPVFCFDGDRAGLGAAYRAVERIMPGLQPGRSAFFCLLAGGMDPDDLIRDRGAAAMKQTLAQALPLVDILWRREQAAGPFDTPERQAGLEQRLLNCVALIQHNGVKAAYRRELMTRMREAFWDKRRHQGKGKQRKAPSPGAVPSPKRTKGLGLLVRAIDNPYLIEAGFELLAQAEFPDRDVCAIRDALLADNKTSQGVDRSSVRNHLLGCGEERAAGLLETFPDVPPVLPDGAGERDWLIALEQYACREGTDMLDVSIEEAFSTVEDGRLRHRLVSERRVRMARLGETGAEPDMAPGKTDQD